MNENESADSACVYVCACGSIVSVCDVALGGVADAQAREGIHWFVSVICVHFF
jgi:hypothetical protein